MKNTSTITGLLIIAATLSGCEQEEASKPLAPRPLLSMLVTPTATIATSYTGSVVSRYTTDLGFEVSGRLTRRLVNVGDIVTAGQPLAEIDPITYQFQVKIAEAELQSAIAQQKNALTSETREKTLLDQNISSMAKFEAARQSRESADARILSAKAKLEKAREQRDNTLLSATSAGVVTDVKAEPGQTIQAGQQILVVARADVREAVVDVPERMGRALTVGAAAEVASQAVPDVKVTGRVREIAPSLDAATRSARVRITLDNPPGNLRLGTLVNVNFSVSDESMLLIPASAVLKRDGKTYVWRVSDDAKVSATEVGVEAQGTFMRVTSGLSSGERIAVAGVNSLSEGQQVKMSEEAAQ